MDDSNNNKEEGGKEGDTEDHDVVDDPLPAQEEQTPLLEKIAELHRQGSRQSDNTIIIDVTNYSQTRTAPVREITVSSGNTEASDGSLNSDEEAEIAFQQRMTAIQGGVRLRAHRPSGAAPQPGRCRACSACCVTLLGRLRTDEQCRFWFLLSLVSFIPSAVGSVLAVLGARWQRTQPGASVPTLYVASILLGIGILSSCVLLCLFCFWLTKWRKRGSSKNKTPPTPVKSPVTYPRPSSAHTTVSKHAKYSRVGTKRPT